MEWDETPMDRMVLLQPPKPLHTAICNHKDRNMCLTSVDTIMCRTRTVVSSMKSYSPHVQFVTGWKCVYAENSQSIMFE